MPVAPRPGGELSRGVRERVRRLRSLRCRRLLPVVSRLGPRQGRQLSRGRPVDRIGEGPTEVPRSREALRAGPRILRAARRTRARRCRRRADRRRQEHTGSLSRPISEYSRSSTPTGRGKPSPGFRRRSRRRRTPTRSVHSSDVRRVVSPRRRGAGLRAVESSWTRPSATATSACAPESLRSDTGVRSASSRRSATTQPCAHVCAPVRPRASQCPTPPRSSLSASAESSSASPNWRPVSTCQSGRRYRYRHRSRPSGTRSPTIVVAPTPRRRM